MTRKEQLEQQYQKSRAENGYGAPCKALRRVMPLTVVATRFV